MRADRKWVERNLGFDPVSKPPPARTFAFKRAAKAGRPEDLQREIIDFDSERRGPQFCVHHGDGTVALHRRAVAEGPGAARPGRRRPAQAATAAAARRRAGRHLDRRRRPCAEPRADAGQGFAQRLHAVHAQLRDDLEEDAQRLSGAGGEAARRVLDDDDRRQVGRRVQVRFAHVAGRTAAAEHRRLAADHRRSAAADS